MNEWLDMFHAIGKPFPAEFVDIARMLTLSGSFLFLLQFGVTIASKDTGKRRLIRLLPLVLVAAWIAVSADERIAASASDGRYLGPLPVVCARCVSDRLGSPLADSRVQVDAV